MAEETVDKCIEVCQLSPLSQCQTTGLLLDGAHDWSPTLFIRLIQDFGVDSAVCSVISYKHQWMGTIGTLFAHNQRNLYVLICNEEIAMTTGGGLAQLVATLVRSTKLFYAGPG